MRSTSFSKNHPYATTRGWVSPKRAASSLPTISDGVTEVDDASEIFVVGGVVSEPEDGVAQISFGGHAVGSNSQGGGISSSASAIRVLNNAGFTLQPGDVVITDDSMDAAVTTTSTASNTHIVGVVQDYIENLEYGPVLFNGFAAEVNAVGSVSRGMYALTSATAGAAGATASRVAGSFAVYLTGTDLPNFVSTAADTEQETPVTSLDITMPTGIPPNRLLFLALWVEAGTSSVDVDGWTLIGAESGFYYYYRISQGDDVATATWSPASVAVASVLLLHSSVSLGNPIEDHDYDTSTSAAAVSGLDTNLAHYAIAGVASDVTSPGSGFTRLGGGATAAAADSLVALFNGSIDGIAYAIGAATRTSGAWTEYASNPVIDVGSSGAWDDSTVKDPCLLYDGTQYVCYYAGYDGTTYRIGRATATSHEGPWTKYASNPVLDVGAGGAIDDAGCAFPTVYDEGTAGAKRYKMWYRADDGTNQTVAYAYSSDGISWTKVGRVIDEGSGGSWNDEGVLPGAIYKDGSTYNLYVGGRQGTTNPRWQGGLYTFSNPEGVYTADAGNPIMLARFNDANTSQVPTGDVSAVATTVGLTTPAAFNVGEPVALIDGNVSNEPGIYYLTAVGGASVTLHRAAGANFESTNGVFRSFAYNALVPRAVLARTGGGYEAFMTAFQPVEDLSVPGSKLFEGAIEMRASALTGTWSYYYTAGRGLLFPLDSTAPSWRTRSAENLSVISVTGSAAGTLAGKYISTASSATSPFTGGGNATDAIFAINLTGVAKPSALLYGPDLGGSGGSPAAQTGGSAPVAAPTTSEVYLHGTDLYVWDGSAWHGPYLISDSGS